MSDTQTIKSTKVNLEWGRLACEFDPQALMNVMSKYAALKIRNSVSNLDDGKVSLLSQGIAGRAVVIFGARLDKALEMFAGGLMTESLTDAWIELNNQTVSHGAKSSDVARLNSELRRQSEMALFKGHRHVWGDPATGRTPATPHEKLTQAQQKMNEFFRRAFDAIAKVRATKGEHELRKQLNVAREVFPKRKKSRGAESALSGSLALYGVTYEQLLQIEKMPERKKLLLGNR